MAKRPYRTKATTELAEMVEELRKELRKRDSKLAKKLAMEIDAPTHSVYVIELDPKVMERPKFAARNPGYRTGRPCMYVGETAKTPEERFLQHRSDYKANAYARDHGLRLLPEYYAAFNPMSRQKALSVEKELTAVLRREGFGVWSG